jgi:hypothetical protein
MKTSILKMAEEPTAEISYRPVSNFPQTIKKT